MPTGRFTHQHKEYFNAIDGAYTSMTAEEVRKGTFNVKGIIKEMAVENGIASALDRNVEACEFNISDKVTGFKENRITLIFKLSKPEPRLEMSIYFNLSAGVPADKLTGGNVWFIYIKANDATPWIGIMTREEWFNVAGEADSEFTVDLLSKVSKKKITKEDLIDEKEFFIEIDDIIQGFDDYLTEPFEYSGKPKVKEEPRIIGTRKAYKRDEKTSIRALRKAVHKCEVDKTHKSFIRKSKNIPYMEPHHLIPIENQDDFENSLDVEENIVSLCSNCHNHLHYGRDTDDVLERLYNERIKYLHAAGIDISVDDLFDLYR